MSTTEPLQGLPYPQGTDSPNGPTQIQALAVAVAPKTVMTFASAAARTAAFAAAGVSPAAGMLTFRTDGGINGYEYWNATAGAWRVFGRYQDQQTLVAGSSSVTFSNIPTYLRTVTVQINARSDIAQSFTNLDFRIAGDSGVNYRHVVAAAQNGTWVAPVIQSGGTSARFGYIPAASAFAGIWGAAKIDFVGWDKPKTGGLKAVAVGGYYDSVSAYIVGTANCDYAGGSSYTSITFLPGGGNFVVGSEFVLSGQE